MLRLIAASGRNILSAEGGILSNAKDLVRSPRNIQLWFRVDILIPCIGYMATNASARGQESGLRRAGDSAECYSADGAGRGGHGR